ncbi:sn-glycerol-3-phosphate ABC transporter ATP-binding protein UgpC [Vibrio vulnificus]|nr:sn-glycerol-3-phosphate ABC transporter ATP-binding protein UgpC [Vibrio vulnificus]
MAQVTLENIKKSFGTTDVIKNVNLDIKDGEFVVFVGPSGCGKSTLLRMIAGLEDISSGDLTIGDQLCNDLTPKERGIAMVFQSYALYPHKTVYNNMAFSLQISGEDKASIDEKVQNAAKILQIEHLLERKPSQLSGGQRQRVAIGRAIVRNPRLFLFDEPLSNLDAALRVDTREEILKLHETLKTTMIYVTHDQVEAMTLADKIVVLNEGIAQQVGAPLSLYHRPRNLFVAGFIGSPKMNFLPATISDIREDGVQVNVGDFAPMLVPVKSNNARIGDNITLGIRPEHIHVSESGSYCGTIRLVERLGGETLLNLRIGEEQRLMVRTDGNCLLKTGSTVNFVFEAEQTHLFGEDGLAFEHLEEVEISKITTR